MVSLIADFGPEFRNFRTGNNVINIAKFCRFSQYDDTDSVIILFKILAKIRNQRPEIHKSLIFMKFSCIQNCLKGLITFFNKCNVMKCVIQHNSNNMGTTKKIETDFDSTCKIKFKKCLQKSNDVFDYQ